LSSGALCQVSPADSIWKSEIVLESRAASGLSPDGEAFDHHRLEPVGGAIDGGAQTSRPGPVVVSAEFSSLLEEGLNARFREATIELAFLTAMVLALVVSLRMLQRQNAPVAVL
jgi:hypothetical protein